jgi:hypothetical protein
LLAAYAFASLFDVVVLAGKFLSLIHFRESGINVLQSVHPVPTPFVPCPVNQVLSCIQMLSCLQHIGLDILYWFLWGRFLWGSYSCKPE